jgi:tRNA 2-thiouridine synthesizing protein A
MSDSLIVDARGLSCPQPVLETRAALAKASSGQVEVLVDTVTARENVGRFARSQGWNCHSEEEGDGTYRVILTR